jgi:hypothetical protein
VDKGLAGTQHAGVKMRCQPMLINPSDLFRNEWGMALIVIHAGDTQHHQRDGAMALVQQRFGADLRFRIGPTGSNRRVLIDFLVWTVRRAMNEHGAGENELLDLEALQPIDQSPRALDGDLFIERVRLARNVVIGGQVDHRGNALAITLPDGFQRRGDSLIGR